MRLAHAFIVMSLACVGALTGYVLGCAPAAKQQGAQQVEYHVTEGLHAEELRECLADTKADAGTFADFCKCWDLKNAKYHVDAGVRCER